MTATTLLAALDESLRSATHPADGTAPPAAILWTDPDGAWKPIIGLLRALAPHLYVIGEYDPANKTGPAIWLRCVVDRTLPESPPEGSIPVLYLPGVSRQVLRSGPDCPPHLRPLVELQFRGAVWHQRNGRDWTVEAFFISEEGLALECAGDAATRLAMHRALPLFADENVDALRGSRLDDDYFNRLAIGDPVRDMLRWLTAPEEFRRERLADGRWDSFRGLSINEFAFDPEEGDPRDAAVKIVEGDRRWDPIWERFVEAPRLYAGIARALEERGPGGTLLIDTSRDPRVNRAAEEKLRRELERIPELPHFDAGHLVARLEVEHHKRRQTPWRDLGLAPFAVVLEPLARLASLSRSSLSGATLDAAAVDYANEGWRCDRAAIDALVEAQNTPAPELIERVVKSLYEPWADASARHFQELADAAAKKPPSNRIKDAPIEQGVCYLFVDGLRYDLGVALHEILESQGFTVQRSHRIAPFPTVTPTAKPAAAPLPASFVGSEDGEDFTPLVASSRQPAITTRFRQELARHGIACVEQDAPIRPEHPDQLGWSEAGDIDKDGHNRQARVVEQLARELERIADRVSRMLDAGWSRVKVVTDHGWLLLPGGLPKFELPAHLVSTKWARCATVKGFSSPEVPTWRWHWNESIRIASPPGIACFSAGNEYAHGGVSAQECVVPELLVMNPARTEIGRIVNVRWMGLRCRVATVDGSGLRVDIRLKPRDASSSIAAAAKEVPATGEVSLVVEDEHEGSSASVVLIGTGDVLIDQRLTTVGEL